MVAIMYKNYNSSAPESAEILVCVISYSKKVALSESHEIACVAYLGQIMIIGRDPT